MNRVTMGLLVMVLLFGVTGGVQSAPIPLSDLLNGQSLTADDKLFDQWQAEWWGSDDLLAPDYSAIQVNPLEDGGLDPGPGIGIDFGDEMRVTGDDWYAYSDLTLSFRVSVLDSDLLIHDNLLDFDGVSLNYEMDAFNDLGVYVAEWVYDAAGALLAEKEIEFSVLDDEFTSVHPDTAEFLPQSEVFVEKNILVWSMDSTDTATLEGVEQRFSQIPVPEPNTLALFALGFVALVWVGGRRQMRRY